MRSVAICIGGGYNRDVCVKPKHLVISSERTISCQGRAHSAGGGAFAGAKVLQVDPAGECIAKKYSFMDNN